jgi:hypothetical protein
LHTMRLSTCKPSRDEAQSWPHELNSSSKPASSAEASAQDNLWKTCH